MTKICHLTVAHGRYDARIFKRECRSLSKGGYEVILLCGDNKPDEIIDGVKIVSWTGKCFSKCQRVMILLNPCILAKKALEYDADIYQFHDIELIRLGLYIQQRGKKVIFDSHENWKAYIEGLNFLPSWGAKMLARQLVCFYRKYLKRFSAVFTVSPNMVTNLKQYTNRVYFVPNYPVVKNMYNLNFKVSNNFIYAGTVYDMSNQIQILKALESVQEANYTIVGKMNGALKACLSKMPAANRVVFVDWVPEKELNEYYSEAIAGIVIFDYVGICCYEEGQLGSNKIFEYMMMGLPVICTDFLLWKELIIDKYNCGICVPPQNEDAIIQAMQYIIDHKEEAFQMGRNGQKAVVEEFNWSRYEQEFMQRYELIKCSKL